MPVPLRAIVSGDPGALLLTEMLPLTLPAAVGAKLAVKEALCPALRVVGTANPLTLKAAPDAVA